MVPRGLLVLNSTDHKCAMAIGAVAADRGEQAPKNEAAKTKIFISYSRKDMGFADRLETALKEHEFEPLIDRTEIYAFEDWWKRIQALIAQADTVVFVLSPDSVTSPVCAKEVAFAASLNKRFAPVVYRRIDDKQVPEALSRLNFIFFDDEAQFAQSLDRLHEALATDIDWIRKHTEYGQAARHWLEAGRPSGLLLHSPDLESAESWVIWQPHGAPAPTTDTQILVAESRKAANAAKRRSRQVQLLIYALLISIIGGLVAWINQSFIATQWRWYAIERPFAAASIWPYLLKPAAEAALKPKDIFWECVTLQSKEYCPKMKVVPAGSFVMGSPLSEKGRYTDEGPLHQVTIDKPFAVSVVEVTFDQWDTCVAKGDCVWRSDAGFGRGRQPVIGVTWDDAERYVQWLALMTGKPYRLLTEAEYEYVARAGSQTAYPWGDEIGENNADCNGCGSKWDDKSTAPVGSFAADAFGVYDMVGNVWEWVEDCYHPNYEGAPPDGSAWITGDCAIRVVRGGAWDITSENLRSANRNGGSSDSRTLGFRIARTLVAP
jgi:formylglycine-generating enzyme required for sulfatase activity